MTGIRFGNSIMIFPDLVNLRRDRRLHTSFEGNLIGFLVINEEWGDGFCLVHAINAANRSILSDRCFRDYCLRYKYIYHSHRRVTFVISESYREICKSFPEQRYFSYRVLVSPISQPFLVQSIALGGVCLRRNL